MPTRLESLVLLNIDNVHKGMRVPDDEIISSWAHVWIFPQAENYLQSFQAAIEISWHNML